MDSRLYFTITLVVLAWLSASTCNATNHTNGTNVTTTAAAPTPTLIASTTVAPALVYNDTVSALEANLTNDGCGTVRLCAGQPSDCNPANSACTLLGAKAKGGNVFEFLLAGESEGYLGAVVSFDAALGGNDTTYICFNDNGQIKFTGASLENNVLTRKTVNANNVRGKITGKKMQCIFDATVDSSTARAARAPDAALGVVSGTYNSSSGSFGAPTTLIKTDPINLSNPNQTVTNNAATTASPDVTMTT
uniref:Ferric-chelate reductase 1a n=1 Tax=Tetraodon nigroviridis TaxID=99883 RepID=H3CPP7_TETNG